MKPGISVASVRCVIALTLVLILGRSACGTIRYTLSLAHPEQHLFHVTMEIPDVPREVVLQMPAWNALYQIRDFSAHIREVEAFSGSERIPVEKVDKLTWKINGTGTITVKYASYWDEPGPFATQLNAEHAFINPAMVLMYARDRRAEKIYASMPDVPGEWNVESAALTLLESMGGARNFGFDVANYDAFADAPIEASKFEEIELPGLKPQIFAIVHGKWNRKGMEDALRRICSYELKLMDGPPYERYMFIIHLGDAARGSGGGMEHANSTAIWARSEEGLIALAAHEFFHLWNVKRIRPATLTPVDYTREQYTRALWFAEGVTNTYGSYTLVRTQLWDKGQFYLDLGQQISELEARPANRWQSAEESSLDAWLEKYPLYNRPQESVSYYGKGQVLGVLLDILIRDRTNNERSLDDVMRAMNTDFARQNKPYRDSLDVRLEAEKVAGSSFEDFFQRYVAHAEPLPYEKTLALAGLALHASQRKRPLLGFYADRSLSGENIVQDVDAETPAWQAGLRTGDVLLSWNGAEPPRSVERWAYSQKPGTEVRVQVRREQQELSLTFRIGEATDTFYQVVEDGHADARAKRIREGILHGTTQPVTARR